MNNTKVALIIIAVVVLGAGGLWFSGVFRREAAQEAVERAIEESSGGSADVDLDSGSVKVKTDEGTFETGKEVSLPSGFPSDLHVIDGTITSATTMGDGTYTVEITVAKTVEQARQEYEAELAADGWTTTFTLTLEDVVSLSATKGNRTATVNISAAEGGTATVVLGVAPTE